MLPRDDVDDAAHRVRAIKQRARTTDHLDTLHVRGHVSIRQGMAEQAGPLGLPVKKDQHLVAATDATDVDRSGGALGDTKSRDALLRHEKARHTLGKHRQQGRLAAGLYGLLVDHRDGQRHAAPVDLDLVRRDDDPFQIDQAIRLLHGIRGESGWHQHKPEGQKYIFSHLIHFSTFIIIIHRHQVT